MDNVDDELMVIAMEECAELQMALSKVIRFGHSEKNTRALKQEIGDVATMIALFLEYEWITEQELNKCMTNKLKKLQKFSSLPIELGEPSKGK